MAISLFGKKQKHEKSYYRGCLLGGAIADARALGINEAGKDLISDNTQMTIFTVDGLIWADNRAKVKGVYAYTPCLFYAYQKWYYTQTGTLADKNYSFILDGEILKNEELFARRGTGNTTIKTLGYCIEGNYGSIEHRINNSKGSGSVCRTAPIGLYFYNNPKLAFQVAMETAAITHGNTDAMLSAGVVAVMIGAIIRGEGVKEAALLAVAELKHYEDSIDVFNVIKRAIILAESGSIKGNKGHLLNAIELHEEFGLADVAEVAVAIAIYLSIVHSEDFTAAVDEALLVSGGHDSVAPLCGNILGAYLGSIELPYRWVNRLELADLMMYGADGLFNPVYIDGSNV